MNLRLNWAGPSVLVLISACAAPSQESFQSTAEEQGEAHQGEAQQGEAQKQTERVGRATPALLAAAVAHSADLKPALAPRAFIRHRSQKDPDAKRHATGRRELTPQESQSYKQSIPKVVAVRPTQLLVDRMRDASALKSAETKTLESNVVPFGSDIVTSSPGEASAPVPLAAVTALPRAVDNSTSPAFPEIRDQGSENSCVAFAVGYYQYTYALGKLLGWNNKNSLNSTKVSPKFLYNLANSGGDYGTGPGTVHDILRTQGALTWSEFPYSGDASNPVNYLAWPTTSALWKSALRYKSMGPASVGSPTEPGGVEQAKSLLANGQVLTFSTYIYSWEFEQLGNDPATSADDALVGQQIVTWQNGSDGGHEATLVGYNDDVWVDINANGVVESGEKGAFKIANSWGASWKNAGYAWIAYDALRAVSQVPNGPSSDVRTPLIGGIMALAGANTNYQPKLLAEFTVSTASRGDLRLALQQTEVDRTDPVDEYQPTMFQFGGGSYAFDGTVTTQPKAASFAVDVSNFALSYGDLKHRIYGQNMGSIASSISGFSLTDRLRNNLKTSSTDPAVTIATNEAKSQSIRYKFQDTTRVPRIAITPSGTSIAFGSLTLGQAAQRTITVQNTGTGDLAVSSLRFDNPLFLNKGASSLRLAPGESRAIELEFAPAASQSETGTLSLRNTSTNLPSQNFSLSGAATSTSDSAPYQVFITQQNSVNDNSVSFRAELKSRVSTSTSLSNYQVVYYLNDSGLDPASIQWDNYYSTVGNISASTRRVFLSRALGSRKADLAVTFRFPAGATLAAGASAVFQGSLRNADYSWYPNESDDWSRYLRRDGLAEGTVVQQISNQQVLFGLAGERTAGGYQLKVTPNPTSGPATVSFVVNNPNEVERSYGVYIFSQKGEIEYFNPTWVPSVGTQTIEFDASFLPSGVHTATVQYSADALDAYTFTKQ